MGLCCCQPKDDLTTGTPRQTNQRARQFPQTNFHSLDTDDSSVNALLKSDMLIEQQRRMSRAEIQQQQAHFLTFKEQMKFKEVKRFHEHYSLKKEIGSGAFGTVKIGEHRRTRMPCAIKIIRKESLKVHNIYEELNKNELEVLEITQHPHITRIFELMEDERNYYIIAEFMAGGHLLDKITQLRQFSEQQAASVVKQMLLALNFMHGKNIMHRDLKPENILCERSADVGEDEIFIKLTDFGFATKYDPNGQKHTLSLGSPLYMAPELCKEIAYDNKVDVWSVGVITYILLTGRPPFYDKNSRSTKAGIYKDIINNEPDYSHFGDLSRDALKFVKLTLNKDPSMRPGVDQLL